MIPTPSLAELLPHAGAMVLLDSIAAWDPTTIHCRTRSHLDPNNPLRRAGRLSALCGVEYALQAAALHGALLAGGIAQRAGYVARLRDATFHVKHLDEQSLGTLHIHARLERQEAGGMLYALSIEDEQRRTLLTARTSIALPK